jgi:hypothetical protein
MTEHAGCQIYIYDKSSRKVFYYAFCQITNMILHYSLSVSVCAISDAAQHARDQPGLAER